MKTLSKKRLPKGSNPIYGYDFNWSACRDIVCVNGHRGVEKCVFTYTDGCSSPGVIHCC